MIGRRKKVNIQLKDEKSQKMKNLHLSIIGRTSRLKSILFSLGSLTQAVTSGGDKVLVLYDC